MTGTAAECLDHRGHAPSHAPDIEFVRPEHGAAAAGKIDGNDVPVVAKRGKRALPHVRSAAVGGVTRRRAMQENNGLGAGAAAHDAHLGDPVFNHLHARPSLTPNRESRSPRVGN